MEAPTTLSVTSPTPSSETAPFAEKNAKHTSAKPAACPRPHRTPSAVDFRNVCVAKCVFFFVSTGAEPEGRRSDSPGAATTASAHR
jgi:hypothetical protein